MDMLGKRLHCYTCSSDRPFNQHSDHKHWGKVLKEDSFIECIGQGCNRCERWFSRDQSRFIKLEAQNKLIS